MIEGTRRPRLKPGSLDAVSLQNIKNWVNKGAKND
jgi:hypothetical protein